MSLDYSTPPLNGDLEVLDDRGEKRGTTRWSQPWKNWLTVTGIIVFDVQRSGTTANRPTRNLYVGKPYFDTTLAIPIWYDANGVTGWCDAAGNNV